VGADCTGTTHKTTQSHTHTHTHIGGETPSDMPCCGCMPWLAEAWGGLSPLPPSHLTKLPSHAPPFTPQRAYQHACYCFGVIHGFCGYISPCVLCYAFCVVLCAMCYMLCVCCVAWYGWWLPRILLQSPSPPAPLLPSQHKTYGCCHLTHRFACLRVSVLCPCVWAVCGLTDASP
jgi:hypothetical protein